MSEEVKVVGVPSAILLPSRNFKFKVEQGNYVIELPRKGTYEELDPEFFTENDGDFNFMGNDILYLPSLTKALFAAKKYPDLTDNQAFALLAFKMKEETIEIIGNVIEFLELEE